MTNTAVTWAPIIFSALASGTVAAVVTTFGGQARARRKARTRILRRLGRLEVARSAAFEHLEGGFSLDAELIADLEARCMLAGVPRFAVVMVLRSHPLARCRIRRQAEAELAARPWHRPGRISTAHEAGVALTCPLGADCDNDRDQRDTREHAWRT